MTMIKNQRIGILKCQANHKTEKGKIRNFGAEIIKFANYGLIGVENAKKKLRT